MMDALRRRLAVCLLVMLAWPLVGAAAPALWLADDDKVYQVDLSTGGLLRTLPLPAQALSADPEGGAWLATGAQLLRLGPNGESTRSIGLATLNLAAPVRLACDPRDGSVWVLGDRALLHLDATGTVLSRTMLATDDHAVALAVTLDQRAWVLSKRSLLVVSLAGAVLAQANVSGTLNGPANALAVDALMPLAWVAHDNLNQSGQVVSRNLARVQLNGDGLVAKPIYINAVNDVASMDSRARCRRCRAAACNATTALGRCSRRSACRRST